MSTIAIIGAGNMGASLALGLLRAGYSPEKIKIADMSEEKLAPFAAEHLFTTHINADVVKDANVVILAVKPFIIPEVIQPLAKTLQQAQPMIVSIAAGVSIKILSGLINDQCTIVRAMPNLPATVGCGMSALFSRHPLTKEETALIENIFNAVGSTAWLNNEQEIDAITALSGSGPAYFFFLLEAMEKAALQLGFSETQSKQLILQTAAGAIEMAMTNTQNFAALRQAVTSKGGTTESALQVLHHAKVEAIFIEAIQAAKARSEELSKKLEQDLGVS